MTGDAIYSSVREEVPPTVFMPFAQSREAAAFALMSLTIRSSGDPARLTRAVTEALDRIGPNLTWTFRPLDAQVAASMTQERVTAMLAALFGALSLLLAALGLYGVVSYGASRRTPEIAVRMAMGATRGHVLGVVLGRVGRLLIVAIVAGLGLSAWLARFIVTLLHGVERYDPVTIIGTVILLVVVGFAAAIVPAIRAVRIEPADALRES